MVYSTQDNKNGTGSKNTNNDCLIIVLTFVGGVIILILACVIINSLVPSNPVSFASSSLRIAIPKDTTVIIDEYSEPSFPTGDGYSWTVLQIQTDKIDEFKESLKNSSDWKPLPLPKELAENEQFLQPTFMSGVEGEIPIASATGYYIFIDEQKEGKQSSDIATPFYERFSFNYRFGLFNDKDGRLYIWSIDT